MGKIDFISMFCCCGFAMFILGCNSDEPSHEQTALSSQALVVPAPATLKEVPWEQQPAAPALPEGMTLSERALFHVDTETQLFQFSVRGDSRFSLVGPLEDRLGRRSIQLKTPTGLEEIAPSDWHTPPMGAMNPNGDILVCYNRMIGETSQLTEGMMPDPTQGVLGFCRLRTEQGWHNELQIGSLDRVANWVKNVTALERGAFRVQYQADDGWLYDPDERHSILSQTIEDGAITRTSFIRPLFEDRP